MQTLDIPQANALETVRTVLRAVHLGARTIEDISHFTAYSDRHVQYRVHAARILGLAQLERDQVWLTTLGEKLMDSERRSDQERIIFYDAIQACPVIQIVAPDLLSDRPPTVEELSERIFQQSKLSLTTAERRAGGLMTWRQYVLNRKTPGRKPVQGRAKKNRKPVQLSLF